MVKEDCACAAIEKKSARRMEERIGRRRRINHPQEEMEDSAEAILRQCEERKREDFNTENTEDAEKRGRSNDTPRQMTNVSSRRAWWRGLAVRVDAQVWIHL